MGNQLKNVAVVACLKVFLFLFNIVFWLWGLLALTAGVWAELELAEYMQLSAEFSAAAPRALIGAAALAVLLSSVAFTCIVRGQPVLLYVYGGFLAVIFMMEAGVGAAAGCYLESCARGLRDGLTHHVAHRTRQTSHFERAQAALHCCGVSNYTDWIRLSPQRVVPTSCCVSADRCVTANYSDVYQEGCYEVIVAYIARNARLLAGAAAAAGLFPLLGCALSCALAAALRRDTGDAVV